MLPRRALGLSSRSCSGSEALFCTVLFALLCQPLSPARALSAPAKSPTPQLSSLPAASEQPQHRAKAGDEHRDSQHRAASLCILQARAELSSQRGGVEVLCPISAPLCSCWSGSASPPWTQLLIGAVLTQHHHPTISCGRVIRAAGEALKTRSPAPVLSLPPPSALSHPQAAVPPQPPMSHPPSQIMVAPHIPYVMALGHAAPALVPPGPTLLLPPPILFLAALHCTHSVRCFYKRTSVVITGPGCTERPLRPFQALN